MSILNGCPVCHNDMAVHQSNYSYCEYIICCDKEFGGCGLETNKRKALIDAIEEWNAIRTEV
jgi:hypothetical protein